MIQAPGKKPDGSSFLVLVLEPGNLHLLQQNQPIIVHVESHFPDGMPKRLELLISYSETPVATFRELKDVTDMAFDERSAVKKRPHCPEFHSTIEQFGIHGKGTPVFLIVCPACGCVLGAMPAVELAATAKE